jgi:NAD(P)-dependent dehydrogenase (short-subunit alcohol dehydrogenase family)
MSHKKTAIVTGAERGIGAGLVQGVLKDSYNLVATSLNATRSLTALPRLKAIDAAIAHFETIATHGDEKMQLQAMRGAVVKFLTKAFDGEILFEAVRVALAG